MTSTILIGDARERLAELPDGSVGCCVTSPPYYGLRDYGHDKQIGLEETPEAYIENLVQVFREVRRVLRDDGTLWINIGDSSAGSWGAQGRHPPRKEHAGIQAGGPTRPFNALAARQIARAPVATTALRGTGVKPKDLYGIPWMLAFALRADGWFLRQEVIWHKPNAMPESVRDRCTDAHETVFLLAKSRRYFFDSDAIAEPVSETPESVARRQRGGGKPVGNSGMFGEPGGQSGTKVLSAAGAPRRNARSVWSIPTEPSALAHFAMMPTALAERCIAAGTSAAGCCAECGARWRRQTKPLVEVDHSGETSTSYAPGTTAGRLAKLRQAARAQGMEYTGERITTGWAPSCECGPLARAPLPDVVLDPFAGAGTTGLVASAMQRDSILVELNPGYGSTARDRIDGPLFAQASS